MIKIYSKDEKGNKKDTVTVELNVKGSRLDLIREMTAILAAMEDQHPEIFFSCPKPSHERLFRRSCKRGGRQ